MLFHVSNPECCGRLLIRKYPQIYSGCQNSTLLPHCSPDPFGVSHLIFICRQDRIRPPLRCLNCASNKLSISPCFTLQSPSRSEFFLANATECPQSVTEPLVPVGYLAQLPTRRPRKKRSGRESQTVQSDDPLQLSGASSVKCTLLCPPHPHSLNLCDIVTPALRHQEPAACSRVFPTPHLHAAIPKQDRQHDEGCHTPRGQNTTALAALT